MVLGVGNAQFQEALETALSVLVRLPANRILRARISSFLHRMVDCLATRVFPLLHSTLSMLLASSEVTDLSNILQLLNQLTAKFKVHPSTLDWVASWHGRDSRRPQTYRCWGRWKLLPSIVHNCM
jgi:hypothetical protein